MEMLKNILNEIWLVTVEMAPYLLFGFLMAGILSQLISRDFVKRHLGGNRLMGSIKAALVGVPMPICSCGVIPFAALLRKHGASRGATASFLASTPQTGVDSLLVTYALLGWFFSVFRALAAFLSGILCGIAVEAVPASGNDKQEEEEKTEAAEQRNHILLRMLKYGFITLPGKIAQAMLIGIIISGVISGIIPDNFFADRLGHSPFAMILMLFIGIPLYVCSSASVPIALAFIKAGLSPGAALVFLITGPATNAATLTTLWQIIGKKELTVFLITLSLCALAAGFIINFFSPALGIEEQVCHMHESNSPLNMVWTILLLAVLIKSLLPSRSGKT
ncbi:permease [Pontiella agarivorans]|uniref:Permease n=1 Tax=Pontiella agarivorans TaxID=3038953 RepID=A0ABU5MT83_9BACT|nr:permease [Pontiella agarivorans]MDZ8117425.1 permease [Pontiella agarivorans]